MEPVEKAPGVPLRILIAGNDSDQLDTLQAFLESKGYQIALRAMTREALLEYLGHEQLDLVMISFSMARTNRFEATKKALEDVSVPILFFTEEAVSGEEVARYPAVFALLKLPMDSNGLHPAIAIALRRFAEYQDVRKEAANLQQALFNRKIIERAKGILMSVRSLDEPDAYKFLQKLASTNQWRLEMMANAIVICKDVFVAPEQKPKAGP